MGDFDGVDGGGVGGSCCCDDCCPRLRLSAERLMLTRVWVSSERAADRGGGDGTKTGGDTRARRLVPSSPDGLRGAGACTRVDFRGGGLSASRSNAGRDEPILPEGMAISNRDSWGVAWLRAGAVEDRGKVKELLEGGAERGAGPVSGKKDEKDSKRSTDCLSFLDRRRRCMLSFAL